MGHCWRSRNELINDVLLWSPSDGRAKSGRPARTYMQQLCGDKGCSLEDVPEEMDNSAVDVTMRSSPINESNYIYTFEVCLKSNGTEYTV